jgi:hypothetical protein
MYVKVKNVEVKQVKKPRVPFIAVVFGVIIELLDPLPPPKKKIYVLLGAIRYLHTYCVMRILTSCTWIFVMGPTCAESSAVYFLIGPNLHLG